MIAFKDREDFQLYLLKDIYQRLYEAYGPQGWWPAESWFEIVVGAVLTQNTAWRNVEKAIDNLKKNGVLDPQKMLEISEEDLAQLIRPAGFWRVKSKRLKRLLTKLSEYDFDFEKIKSNLKREELLAVDGIGPETADSILLYAFDRPYFVVDNYTRRILNRLGLLSDKASYVEIQRVFHSVIEDVYTMKEFHALIVEHAKRTCKKNNPRCGSCVLKDICRCSGFMNTPFENPKSY